jgi:GLPGLI family protein
MKNAILLSIVLMPLCSFSQKTSGEIKFQETVQLQIDLPEGQEELRKSIPNSQSVYKALLFNGNESYYKDDAPNEDLEVKHEEDGMDMQIVMKSPENNIYTNKEKNQLIQSTEFFGKYFLITGDLNTKKWKLSNEQKQILGYTCKKASLVDTSQQLTAWFTSEIPFHGGPGGNANLPGMVLGIDIDNGQRTILATKINFKEIKEGEIIKPEKGKKVTATEFKKIRDEKMKEMGMVNGKGGAVKMIIREERD